MSQTHSHSSAILRTGRGDGSTSENQIDAAFIFARADFVNVPWLHRLAVAIESTKALASSDPSWNNPAHEGVRLQPERDAAVRCSALLRRVI